MYDNITTAGAVSRWTGLGIELPKELGTAIEVFESIRWVETGHAVEFDLTAVTAENAEDAVAEFAHRLIPALKTGEHLSRTALDEAKHRMLDAAAREVLSTASVAVPGIIEQLTPEFEEHAAAYVAAVDVLPDTIDSESLVKAGAVAVAAYATAQDEAAWLNNVSSWVAGTRNLPGFVGLDVDVPLRILRPSNAIQLAKLDAAMYVNQNQTLGALNKVFYTAAREGIEFGINTLRECAETRQALAVTPQNLASRITMH